VASSVAVVGTVRTETAAALGLPARIPVSGGGGDNMCAAIGVGAVVEGPVVVSLGTSGTAYAHRAAPAVDPAGEAAAFCDSTGGWLPLVATLNCTLATEWIRSLIGLERAGFDAALGASPPGARGLVFLPHLDGERTPNAPRSAGAFAGLRAEHGREDLVRAVTEGVTLGLVYALRALARAGIEATEITLVGGGAASDAWGQLCADAFGLPVRRHPQQEAAAVGAARQARAAVDGLRVADLGIQVAAGDAWEPRPTPALEAAAQRLAALRQAAVDGLL
jgi:xylulokinase